MFDILLVGSSRRGVNAPVHNYAALYQHFKQRSESKFLKAHHRASYTGMIRKMLTVRFVEDLVLVNTCLAELPGLSKTTYTRHECNKANKHIMRSINSLCKMRTAVSENKYSFRHQVALSSEQQKLVRADLHLYESRSQNVCFEKRIYSSSH